MIILWDAQTGTDRCILDEDSGAVTDLLWSPDGLMLVSGTDNGTVRLWDANSGEPLIRSELPESAVLSMIWLPTSDSSNTSDLLVASVNNIEVGLWLVSLNWPDNSATIEEIATVESIPLLEFGEVVSVALSPDGNRLATMNFDGTTHVWEIPSGDMLAEMDPRAFGWQVEWSPDGQLLAVASIGAPCGNIGPNGSIRLWHTSSQETRGLVSRSSFGSNVTWSPDGSLVAGVAASGAVQVWDVQTGTRLADWPIDGGGLDGFVSWAPTGVLAVSQHEGGTIQVWELRIGRVEFH